MHSKRGRYGLGTILLLIGLGFSMGPATSAEDETLRAPNLSSPRLSALARELEAGNRDTLAAFWEEVKGKAPLVEPVPGDDRHRRVTFLWRAEDPAPNVALMGGFAAPSLVKPMARLRDTDLWYLTETHPSEARFQYLFLLNGPTAPPVDVSDMMRQMRQGQPRPDPLNPNVFAGRSVVELPDAPPQPWVRERPGVPHGQVAPRKFKSETLKAEYPLTVYTPPGYPENRDRCWLLIAFDGGFPMMEATLDNLLAAGKIPPLVVVGVGNQSQESRNRDLGGSEAFLDFLTRELVPWARKTYRVRPDASHTMVGGVSLGGFMAAYCGLKRPETFRNVIALSPTLVAAPGESETRNPWEEELPGLLARQFATAPRRPVRFHLEVGRYEDFYLVSLLSQTRRLRDVLTAKGYGVTYAEFVGGHNDVCWRGSFAHAVMALTAGKKLQAARR